MNAILIAVLPLHNWTGHVVAVIRASRLHNSTVQFKDLQPGMIMQHNKCKRPRILKIGSNFVWASSTFTNSKHVSVDSCAVQPIKSCAPYSRWGSDHKWRCFVHHNSANQVVCIKIQHLNQSIPGSWSSILPCLESCRNKHHVLPLPAHLTGYYGICDVQTKPPNFCRSLHMDSRLTMKIFKWWLHSWWLRRSCTCFVDMDPVV